MKSYFLAVTITMFLAALFAFQNIGDVTVRFITFEWTFPQGLWEVLIFCTGAAIMWIFSIFALFEVRGKYKQQLRQKDEKIAAVESEKKTILESMAAAKNAPAAAEAETPAAVKTTDTAPAAGETAD